MSTENEQTEPQKDMAPGIFSWNELMTQDTEDSARFYTELFGWKAETMNMGPGMDYVMFKAGDRPVGGMMQLPPEAGEMPTAWMGYVTVEDLAQALARAKELGATICKDITPVSGMGSLAIICDPLGATLGLWEFAKK